MGVDGECTRLTVLLWGPTRYAVLSHQMQQGQQTCKAGGLYELPRKLVIEIHPAKRP